MRPRLPRLAPLLIMLALAGCAGREAVRHAATAPATTPATAPAPKRPKSPQAKADGTVTFRVYQPRAALVEIFGDWPAPEGKPMTRDRDGVWTATLGPIPPGVWAYQFKTDGQYAADRSNPNWKPGREVNASVLDLPGNLPWDRRPNVESGTVRLHDYASTALGRTRRLRVYTPPGYDRSPTAAYPVLYLLHGSGDNESTWTEFGRADTILDNALADGRARPMIVVMPDGHAVGGGEPDTRQANAVAFEQDLLTDVMPFVTKNYRTRPGPDGTAVAGLSMGGNAAIVVGLRHPDLFGYVAGLSSAIRNPERDLPTIVAATRPAATRPGPIPVTPAPRLLWLSVGTEDFLLKENRHFDALLTQCRVPHAYHETPGGHRWPVWRQNLVDLLPQLF